MILVRVQTMDPNDPQRVLAERHVMANTPGGALNSIAQNPRTGAKFIVTIIDTEAADPVYDHGN